MHLFKVLDLVRATLGGLLHGLRGVDLQGFLDLISVTLGKILGTLLSLVLYSSARSTTKDPTDGTTLLDPRVFSRAPQAKAPQQKRTPGAGTKAGASPLLCPETSRRRQNTSEMWNTRARATHNAALAHQRRHTQKIKVFGGTMKIVWGVQVEILVSTRTQ